jgi:hypothetical protein
MLGMPQPLYAKKLQAAYVHLSHAKKLLHATTSACREASSSMHAVVVYALIKQRMLVIEIRRGEEKTKPGTKYQKVLRLFYCATIKVGNERRGFRVLGF